MSKVPPADTALVLSKKINLNFSAFKFEIVEGKDAEMKRFLGQLWVLPGVTGRWLRPMRVGAAER